MSTAKEVIIRDLAMILDYTIEKNVSWRFLLGIAIFNAIWLVFYFTLGTLLLESLIYKIAFDMAFSVRQVQLSWVHIGSFLLILLFLVPGFLLLRDTIRRIHLMSTLRSRAEQLLIKGQRVDGNVTEVEQLQDGRKIRFRFSSWPEQRTIFGTAFRGNEWSAQPDDLVQVLYLNRYTYSLIGVDKA